MVFRIPLTKNLRLSSILDGKNWEEKSREKLQTIRTRYTIRVTGVHRVTGTYMSVLLYVHLKNDVFHISLPSPLYQGNNTLSLTKTITSLVNFLTAYKMLWRLCVIAGTSDSKNPELYYYKIESDEQMNINKFKLSVKKLFLMVPVSVSVQNSLERMVRISTIPLSKE